MRLALAAALAFAPLQLALSEPGQGGRVEGNRPQWIWSSKSAGEGEVVHFRRTFTVPARPLAATLLASCDNKCEVFINGKPAGGSDNWQEPVRSDAAGAIVKGENVLAVRGENEGGPGGLVLRLEMKFADGSKQEIVTGADWLVSGKGPKGWEAPGFDAKDWKPAALIGALGTGPWGDVFAGSPAAAPQGAPPVTGLDGFKVEVLYTVPREEGSWVAMAFDPKGRLIVSPQQGKLLRVSLGQTVAVEKLDVQVGDAQGLLSAFGSLYVTGNGPQGTAMYRLREKGDEFEPAECLKKWPGGMGEHGPHAIVLGPDRKLYCVIGNHVKVPPGLSEYSPHRNYQEDLLLPRLWDPNGHAVGCMAPGGYIVRTDADGKDWEMFCGGFRNEYDAAFNAEGELFTYDSDMEWDIGTPWYRPTRIYHLVQGGEYGWRSATGKWPAWYPDNLPMTADIGLGSPTGMEFGTGAKFPAKYQRALYACDWAYGKIYAVHLAPDGASYRSDFEPFVTGKPLNVADLEVGPDGALYFVTGGRGTQSRLYRVTYAGPEPTAPAPVEASEARTLRRKLEAWHVKREPQAAAQIWPHLSSADRWIRFAARIALENQPLDSWRDRAFYETVPPASLAAMLALARVGPKALQPRILETLGRLGAPWDKAGEDEKLDLLRAYQVVFTRMGAPDDASRALVLKKLDPLYPAAWEPLNRELCQLLVYLDAPKVVERTLGLLGKAETQQEQLHYVFHLRNVKTGWSIEQRKAYFGWLNKGRDFRGGHSFQGFLRNIRRETTPLLSEAERKELDPLLAAGYLPPKTGGQPAKIVQAWTMDDLLPELEEASSGRSFDRGRDVFARAQCLACHRFGNEGGSNGSDLTAVASRFSRRDILESLVLPSKVLSDQYQNTLFQLEGGDVVSGRVIRDEADRLFVRTDPLDEKLTEIPKKSLKASKPSPVSPMPEGLLNILRKPEIWDLLAYLESGGNSKDPRFQKK